MIPLLVKSDPSNLVSCLVRPSVVAGSRSEAGISLSCDNYETKESSGNVDVDRTLSTMEVRHQSSERAPLGERALHARIDNWRCCDG